MDNGQKIVFDEPITVPLVIVRLSPPGQSVSIVGDFDIVIFFVYLSYYKRWMFIQKARRSRFHSGIPYQDIVELEVMGCHVKAMISQGRGAHLLPLTYRDEGASVRRAADKPHGT